MRTVFWFFYFWLSLILLIPKMLKAKRLDEALPRGFHVTSAAAPVHKPADITEAEYTVTFRGAIPDEEEIQRFFTQKELIVPKKSKRGLKDVDIMPMIHQFSFQDGVLTLRLAAGTPENLNPELVMTHFSKETPWDYQICRQKIYCGTEIFT